MITGVAEAVDPDMELRYAWQLLQGAAIIVDMATIHISEAEAARDLAGLLARVRSGEEVVIEKESSPAVVLRVKEEERPLRRLSESLRLAREHGSTVTLDGDFGRDLEAAINSHPEPLENLWD